MSETRRINILHLRDTHEVGGPGKTILETFRAIDSTRFRPHLGVFLTRHEREDTPFVTAAREYGMPVHFIRGFNQFDPRMIWRVVKLVQALQIDIISAHEVKSDVITYFASLLHPVPIVTTLHGWIGNSRKQRLFIALDRLIVRRFDRVIAVSGRIRDDVYAAAVPVEKVRLLHNAVVIGRYAHSSGRGYLGKLLGQPLARPVIASIGRLSPEKGHADLIEAIGMAAARGCRMSAVLVGDGPERDRLVERIRALGLQGSVHLLGYLRQPERVLAETDLAVLPSHTEGLPNAALEALAMEVPVLATRVGGTPEVITDGETGRLVEPRSPEALADALVDFANDPLRWKEMAQRGRLQVDSHFNFQTRTRELEQIYLELSQGNRA